MITAQAAFAGLSARLTRKAATLAAAQILARNTEPDWRWRSARLLWPLFGDDRSKG